MPEARAVIGRGQYFVVHAPRQTGRTTTLDALARDLRAQRRHVVLLVSCEGAKVTGDDYGAAGRATLHRIAREARIARLPSELMPPSPWPDAEPDAVLLDGLTEWALNGGGYVDREYAVGRDRIDLLVRKPYVGLNGKPAEQREAIELKVQTGRAGDPLADGLDQFDGYLERFGLAAGYLLIFDRRPSAVKKGLDPAFSAERTFSGREVTLLRA